MKESTFFRIKAHYFEKNTKIVTLTFFNYPFSSLHSLVFSPREGGGGGSSQEIFIRGGFYIPFFMKKVPLSFT